MKAASELSAVDRAFPPPRRRAPLIALAAELRRPGIWLQACRRAAAGQPTWLDDRLRPSDPLTLAIGACGDPDRDTKAVRATCILTLGLCGRFDERRALEPAARLLGEVPPEDLSRLDPGTQPLLTELVAALRGDRPTRSRRVSTVVSDPYGKACPGSVAVDLMPDLAPGLRLDGPARLFSAPDPALEAAVAAAARQLGPSPPPLRVGVESESGDAGGGEACGSAIAAAADAALRKRRLDEEVVVLGALRGDGTLVPSRSPEWDEARAVVDRIRPAPRVLAAAGRGIKNMHALRRALGAKRRRRRALGATAVGAACLALAAAAIVPSLGTDRNADQAAGQAKELLASNPLQAALRAARALSLREDGLSRGAAAKVLAAAPLTEATGQEDGHLLAVAIDDSGTVTTVSTKGRATRWALRGDHLRSLSAAGFPADSSFRAISPDGRWLLVSPPESYERALLVDTAGHHASRYLVVPEEGVYAVAGAEHPIVAIADSDGLRLPGGGTAPPIDGDVEALGFAPSGRRLAVAASGEVALYRRGRDGWSRTGEPRQELPPIAGLEIKWLEVDNRGNTLISVTGLGTSLRWSSSQLTGEYRTSDGVGSLAGRSLYFLRADHALELREEASDGGTTRLISFPAPPDAASDRPVAVSASGDRAVVAAPEGLFSVIDLRRVRPVKASVVTDSVAVRDHRLSALLGTPKGSRSASWDLRSLSPPRLGPVIAGEARIGLTTDRGALVAATTDREEIVIRRTTDGIPVGRLRGRGNESWTNIAADRDGKLLAAVDERRGATTVWRLEHHGSHLTGQIVFRGLAADRPEPDFPEPLAISPSGRWLIDGSTTELLLHDLRTGSRRQLPTAGVGEVIRVRFGTSDRRVLLATTRGVTELSGPDWSEARQLSESEAHDARALGSGFAAAANPHGVQLLTGREPTDLYTGVDENGVGPGTLSTSWDGSTVVPNLTTLPVTVLTDPNPSRPALCALAGGRNPDSNGCGPRPPLPKALPAAGRADDRGLDFVLSPSGLGAIRFGRPPPPEVRRLPGYSWGACSAKTLRERSAMVVSHEGKVESIALFTAPYVSEDAGYPEELEVATDRGLTPSGALTAEDLYGPPDKKRGEHWFWRLPRADGGHSLLTVSIDYDGPVPITMAIAKARCDTWG